MRHLILPLLLVITAPAITGAQTIREQLLARGVTEEVVIVDYPSVPLRELTLTAGAVVRVSIRSTDALLTADGAGIVTDYRAAIVDVLKDPSNTRFSAGDVITIRRLGGAIDIEGRKVVSNEGSFPPFAQGTEYLLFLKTETGQPFELLAGPQSAFRVHEDTIVSASEQLPSATIPVTLFVDEVRRLSR